MWEPQRALATTDSGENCSPLSFPHRLKNRTTKTKTDTCSTGTKKRRVAKLCSEMLREFDPGVKVLQKALKMMDRSTHSWTLLLTCGKLLLFLKRSPFKAVNLRTCPTSIGSRTLLASAATAPSTLKLLATVALLKKYPIQNGVAKRPRKFPTQAFVMERGTSPPARDVKLTHILIVVGREDRISIPMTRGGGRNRGRRLLDRRSMTRGNSTNEIDCVKQFSLREVKALRKCSADKEKDESKKIVGTPTILRNSDGLSAEPLLKRCGQTYAATSEPSTPTTKKFFARNDDKGDWEPPDFEGGSDKEEDGEEASAGLRWTRAGGDVREAPLPSRRRPPGYLKAPRMGEEPGN